MSILQALHLKKTYKKRTVVSDVSLDVESGSIVGLLGPNGAGKTTTMRLLSTLIKPDSGDAFYDDISVVNQPELVRSRIAFLTMDLKLDVKSTANSMFDFFAELYHVPKEQAKKRKEELFEGFHIGSFADTKISKLSQGMRQKVSLAISVLHDPEFIIFDEPTNGLDIISTRDVRKFILDMKERNKCIIISTHLFDLVERICDRAAMIINGKIAANDTIKAFTKDKSLEDTFYDIYIQHNGGADK